MAKNYVQPGKTITVAAPANVLSGAGVQVGSLFGVAQHDALENADVEIDTQGVWELPKVSAQAWTVGIPLYWDNTAKLVTSVASTHKMIGVALAVADNPSAAGVVRLSGPPGIISAVVAGSDVADLTEDGGAIGGTNDGDLPDLDATAATVTGTLTGTTDGALADVAAIAISTAGGNTYADSAVNDAVNTAITAVNLQLKELQVALNEVIADNVALRAAIRELAADSNAVKAELRTAAVIA